MVTDPSSLRIVQMRAATKAVTLGAIRVTNRAKELAPVDTGTLRRSLTYSVTGSTPENLVARVGSNVEHSVYVSLGTKPHVIKPRRANVLRFPAKGSGFVFAKIVHHPGTKANDYLVRALQALRG